MTVKAIYRDGSFIPEAPVDMPDGAEVELTISGPVILPPEVTDPEERRRIMEALMDEWEKNPWPITRNWTRDELHERR
jgi:predicted DNA-binding antitoxin AbrB/MazE fold protein